MDKEQKITNNITPPNKDLEVLKKHFSHCFDKNGNFENGKKKLHFIVETKNVNSENSLREEEKQKIRHAEKFFNGDVKIEFKTQFSNNRVLDLIREIVTTPNTEKGDK